MFTFSSLSGFKLTDRSLNTTNNVVYSRASKTLACATLVWLLIFATCKRLLWRDPHAAFFSETGAYDLKYSLLRQAEAQEYIHDIETNVRHPRPEAARQVPVICAAITTFKRDGRQYLNGTVGTMLAGLTNEERSLLEVRLLFAHADGVVHPDWDSRWLDTVDHWSGYNVSQEDLTHIQELEKAQNFYAKGVYDYIYVLRECLENTDAPYIAIFEDDIVFAEAWLAKTMNSLAELRQRSQSWLYLRLFYTETSLGWQASDDFWYGHQLLTFSLAMTAVFLFLLLGKRTSRCLSRRLDTATLLILVLIATPAFTLLGFMIGKYNLQPLMGVERMDKHGCCTQALVFPRSQVPSLISFLHGRQSGQTDSLIEEHADAQGYERYALAPQVVQHIGLISSRNNLAVNTRSTWAFWFEAQDPLKLKEEHERLARSGIWRTTSDGIQMPNSAGT